MIEFVWKKTDLSSFLMYKYMTHILCYLLGEIDEYFTEEEKTNMKFSGYLISRQKEATLLLFDSKYPELQEKILGYIKQPHFISFCKATSIPDFDAHIYDYDGVDAAASEKEEKPSEEKSPG